MLIIMIVMSALLVSAIALNNSMPNASANSSLSANEKVSIMQADQEVRFNGTAIEYFSSTGTCSWKVRVEKIVSGPSELQGHTVTVALWSGDSGEFPSGHMDPEIEPGGKVGVYGLYVGDDYVTLSGSEEYYINVIAAGNPTANFDYAPPDIFANQKVTFDASTSYDPDGVITKYDWDFGDGTKGTGVIVTHSYTAHGKYNVVLTVTDDGGSTNSKSNEITVEEAENAIYVPDNYPTIQQAVDAAESGETIIVRAGSYTENVVVNKPHLTIRSENGAGVTIVQAAKTNDKAFEVTADYVSVSGFTFKGANYTEKAGIYLTNANYCNVSDNTAYANYVGIYLWKSNNNTVIKNTLCTNDNAGLRSYHSSGNVITRNNVSRNYWNGIVIGGAYNTLSDNVASSNSYSGILVSRGSNNIICNNDIRSNKYYGIRFSSLWDSCNNIIYLNSFVDNSANFYSNNVTNIWSSLSKITYTYNGNTYTSHLGNYWDDYTGSDANGDGIGETAYSINADKDNYPLLMPVENYIKKQTITIDTTPPEVTIISPEEGVTYEITEIALEVAANEPIAKWSYNLNGAGPFSFTPNITLTASERGNSLVVYAEDFAGNVGAVTVSFRVFIIAPTISNVKVSPTYALPGNSINISADVFDSSGVRLVKAFATKGGEGVCTIFMLGPGGTGGFYTGTWRTMISTEGGIYNISISATDTEGNEALAKPCKVEIASVATGSISIGSTPSGATIILETPDGPFIGPTVATPYTFSHVPVGTSTITLSLDGYLDWSTKVYIMAGETSYVHATLTPI